MRLARDCLPQGICRQWLIVPVVHLQTQSKGSRQSAGVTRMWKSSSFRTRPIRTKLVIDCDPVLPRSSFGICGTFPIATAARCSSVPDNSDPQQWRSFLESFSSQGQRKGGFFPRLYLFFGCIKRLFITARLCLQWRGSPPWFSNSDGTKSGGTAVSFTLQTPTAQRDVTGLSPSFGLQRDSASSYVVPPVILQSQAEWIAVTWLL